MLKRVFDAFVQNRQGIDRSQGGLGLGLAIVRSLVALHAGTVRAYSEGEGKGSEFVVELPHPKEDPSALPATQSSSAQEPFAAPALHATARVLVVDDNEDAAMLMSEALDALGYAVRTAPDGPTALTIAEEFRPQVALLDIGLPVMDGYELAHRLREIGAGPAPRLIAVTGYGQGADERRSLDAGFEAHLVKPIALEQLHQVFERLRESGD